MVSHSAVVALPQNALYKKLNTRHALTDLSQCFWHLVFLTGIVLLLTEMYEKENKLSEIG